MTCPWEIVTLKRAEEWSTTSLHHKQGLLLTKLLINAKKHVPYYKGLLPTEEQIKRDPWGTVANLPLLTKNVIRVQGKALRTSRVRFRVRRNTSGGSTGEPAVFYQDAAYRRWNRAGKIFFDRWTGYTPGQRKIELWAAPQDVHAARSGLKGLARRFRNSYLLDAFRMDSATMDSYLQRLQEERPQQLQVYAESGYELARHAQAKGTQLSEIGAILSSAGTLYPDMRETMERAFGAPVFNRYGSREVGDIACECDQHQGLHVNPLTHYVELLRDDGTKAAHGEPGKVVVTSLHNFSMPLIRYEIGDLASWAGRPCTCGCSWPLLDDVWGRVTDHIRGINGSLVYGGWLRHLLFDEEWIQKYQWVQKTLSVIELKVQPIGGVDVSYKLDCLVDRLQGEVCKQLGDQTRLSVELVGELAPSASGKHLYVKSELHL